MSQKPIFDLLERQISKSNAEDWLAYPLSNGWHKCKLDLDFSNENFPNNSQSRHFPNECHITCDLLNKREFNLSSTSWGLLQLYDFLPRIPTRDLVPPTAYILPGIEEFSSVCVNQILGIGQVRKICQSEFIAC